MNSVNINISCIQLIISVGINTRGVTKLQKKRWMSLSEYNIAHKHSGDDDGQFGQV